MFSLLGHLWLLNNFSVKTFKQILKRIAPLKEGIPCTYTDRYRYMAEKAKAYRQTITHKIEYSKKPDWSARTPTNIGGREGGSRAPNWNSGNYHWKSK